MALEEPPTPTRDILTLERLLGADQLARLVGVSAASLYRYRSGGHPSPSLIAARAQFLAVLVSELAGTYNEKGIPRWFERRRNLLDGKSPAELLSGDWDPDEPGPQRVRELTRALSGRRRTK